MIEAFALILLRQRLPIELCGLKQRQCAHHVGSGEGERVLDGTVDVTFGSQVDDAVDPLVLHQTVESVEIADVHLHELIVRLVLYVLQVGQIAGIGQLVKVDDTVFRVFIHKQAYYMTTDKTCTTCDYDVSLKFHVYYSFKTFNM